MTTEVCGYEWPLDDPNLEDLSMGSRHHCILVTDHSEPHRCACGAFRGRYRL